MITMFLNNTPNKPKIVARSITLQPLANYCVFIVFLTTKVRSTVQLETNNFGQSMLCPKE